MHLQGSQTLDLRGLLFPLNHSPVKIVNRKSSFENEMDPPAGDAPAESLYKSDPQAAAWRQKGRAKTFAVSGAAPDIAGL